MLLTTVLACGSTAPSSPSEQREALAASACSSTGVKMVDLHGDFRDIWAGRETADTGKEADPAATVALDFNVSVAPSSVVAQYAPVKTDGSCGTTVASTLTGSVVAGTVWGTASSDAARPTTPASYNVLVREDIQGVVSAGGPLAAGGNVTLSSMSVNGAVREPVGLIAGGKVVLSSGSITGDLTYGVASSIPGTVTITGKRSLQPFNAAGAFSDLESLSILLADEAANGTVQSANGGLQLNGTKSGLNVFNVSASGLQSASSIQITVPAGAGAVVNVTGGTVELSNKGLSISGATAATILWNFVDARFLHVSSIGIQGTVLAPKARLTFDSGSINGVVVARSFSSSGSGSLQYTALKATSLFVSSTPSSVRLQAKTPLVRGCTYVFSIPATVPLTSTGGCLSAPVNVTFRVAAANSTPATRELVNVQPDPTNGTLRRFTPRPGINTPVGDALGRYQNRIGASVADLVASDVAAPSPTRRGQTLTFYQQYAQGYPIAGYGYSLAAEGGIFRSALGKVTPALPIFPTPGASQSTALQSALTFLKIVQAPWVAKPSQFQAPIGQLVVVPKRLYPAVTDFALVWSFRLGGSTGISDPQAIEVDAGTGTVLATSSGKVHLATFDPTQATYVQQSTTAVDTAYNGSTIFDVAQYTAAGGSAFTTLATGNVLSPGVLSTAIGHFDSAGNITGDPQFVVGPPPGAPWTTGNPVDSAEQPMASAQWGLEQSVAFLSTLGLAVGDMPWPTIDGAGHQRVIVHYVDPGSANTTPGAFFQSPGDADTAKIAINVAASQVRVEPDTVSHEFAHALVANLRRTTGNLGILTTYKEAGSINEGVADVFATAFNHEQISSSDRWWCVLAQNVPTFGPPLTCLEDTRNPGSGSFIFPNGPAGQPGFYLDAVNFYKDFSTQPVTSCGDGTNGTQDNDGCGAHLNSTIVSHWAYLLAAGPNDVLNVPCGLQLAALDPGDIDNSYRQVLRIALLAVGSLIGPGATNAIVEPNFNDFREATIQVTQDLVSDGVLSDDALLKVELAWAAVGLAPAYSATSIAAPANASGGLYPWADFMWAEAGDGQASLSGWDFQIADSFTFDTNVTPNFFEQDGITAQTSDSNGNPVGTFDFALPSNSDSTFYWRVRPHPASPEPWLNCYPVHAFAGTTAPDAVNDLRVVPGDLDQDGHVNPGPFELAWDVVRGTASPDYDIKVGLADPQCQDGADVVDPRISLASDQGTESANVGFVAQPSAHYVVDVQPIGPMDFSGKPSRGGCFPLVLDTGTLHTPKPLAPLIADPVLNNSIAKNSPQVYRVPWVLGLSSTVFGGTSKTIVNLYDRDESGNCGTDVAFGPFEDDQSCSRQQCDVTVFTPSNDVAPNATGYCWDVVAEADNGQRSPVSMPKGKFQWKTETQLDFPGQFFHEVFENSISGTIPGDSFGQPITFKWETLNFPGAPLYGFKIGRAPWSGTILSAPEPSNCTGNMSFCLADTPFPETKVVQTTGITDSTYTPPVEEASKGRYCWEAWPIFADADGKQSIRQPLVDFDEALCYTTGPALPTATVPQSRTAYVTSSECGATLPDISTDRFVPDPFVISIGLPYIPNNQLQGLAQGQTGPSGQIINFDASGCGFTGGFKDAYDCMLPINVTPAPNTTYTVDLKTFNSGASPDPVMNDASQIHHVCLTVKTGGCGVGGLPCCEDNPPCAENFSCDNQSNICGCGVTNLACCNGTDCNDGSVCVDTFATDPNVSKTICFHCSHEDEPCCAGGGCDPGLHCDQSKRVGANGGVPSCISNCTGLGTEDLGTMRTYQNFCAPNGNTVTLTEGLTAPQCDLFDPLSCDPNKGCQPATAFQLLAENQIPCSTSLQFLWNQSGCASQYRVNIYSYPDNVELESLNVSSPAFSDSSVSWPAADPHLYTVVVRATDGQGSFGPAALGMIAVSDGCSDSPAQ